MKTKNKYEFCQCQSRCTITAGFEDDFGYWDVCCGCGKRIEDGYHYYNHYDGSDHEEFWTVDGDIESENDDDE